MRSARNLELLGLAPVAGFSKLLATGLTAVFATQAFPPIGAILPFVSYATSSIVANFVRPAPLPAISDRARRETGAPGQPALTPEGA